MNAPYVMIDGVPYSPKHPKAKALQNDDSINNHSLPNPEPKRNNAPALDTAIQGKAKGLVRTQVRFVGYRVRPLDPDNFAGSVKNLLDGLRHARLIHGDEPWRIILETHQIKVSTFAEEKTVVIIETP